MSQIEIPLASFTHDLWEMLQKYGRITVSHIALKEALHDETEEYNAKIGTSGRDWLLAMTGIEMPTKRESFYQWCEANDIEVIELGYGHGLELQLRKGISNEPSDQPKSSSE